jgi:hypothetical protein
MQAARALNAGGHMLVPLSVNRNRAKYGTVNLHGDLPISLPLNTQR